MTTTLNKLIFNSVIFNFVVLAALSITLASCSPYKSKGKFLNNRTLSSFTTPTSLTAIARVTLRETGLKGRANIFVQSPDSFRIEVLGPFDKIVALIVSDGLGFSIFDGKTFKFHDLTLEPYPLKFKPEDMVSFLMGSLSVEKLSRDFFVEFDKENFTYSITPLDEDDLSAKLSNYREVDGAAVPFSILIDFNNEKLNIEYKSVEINPELDKVLFTHPKL